MNDCSGTKADGGSCTRTVHGAGGRCWQHAEDLHAEPLNLVGVARQGRRRSMLVALRDRLAIELDHLPLGVEPKTVADVTRRLQSVLSELETIDQVAGQEDKDPVDELEARRRDRTAGMA